MTEENPKLDFRIFLKKEKSTKRKKIYNVNLDKPLSVDNLLKSEKAVFVKMKEDWIDRVVKISALIAVLLALGTILFDYQQSKDQDVAFKSFQRKLDSTFNIQLKNAEGQHQKTIATLEQQQVLMKNQNDSTIELLRVQADNLKAQNKISKINQKNEILIERVKITPIPADYLLRRDTLRFTLNYQNSGQRVAKNIECLMGIFTIDTKNQISLLLEEKVPLTMNRIVPGNAVKCGINKDFPGRINNNTTFIYSSFTYEDEMFQKKFTITDFMRVFNKDSITSFSFCDQKQIDYIENHSHYRDIEIEDFTIKDEFLFK